MPSLNQTTVILVALLSLKTFAELFLNRINHSHVKKLQGPIPASWKGIFDQASFTKTINYTLSKSDFSFLEAIVQFCFLMLLLLGCILPWLFYGLQSRLGYTLSGQVINFLLMTLILGLPFIPLEWWSQFKIEEKYGFNKSTLKLWISDKLKGAVLSLVIGFPILWLLLVFFQACPETWWIWGFAALLGLQITLQLLYPWLILPLFNKRTPLEEGDLKDRLLRLAKKANFTAKTVQVIDGSKRSSHSNAFFSGFGKLRCIILYDTLIEQLSPEEVEAVLAHEIGHYKKGHIPKRLILSAIMMLAGFKLLDWLISSSWFYTDFGFSPESGAIPAIILFSFFSNSILFWTTPMLTAWSRKHEYEADAFAKDLQGTSKHLISGLKKLYKENLSNLDPHPLYSKFYYSHPTLLERERALKAK